MRNRTVYIIKDKYYIKLPTKEIREMLRMLKEKIGGSSYRDLVPKIEPMTSVLVHCNMVDNDYQRDSKLLYTDQPFGSLLSMEPRTEIFTKTFGRGFYDVSVWFMDQAGNDLDVEDAISLTLVIKDKQGTHT